MKDLLAHLCMCKGPYCIAGENKMTLPSRRFFMCALILGYRRRTIVLVWILLFYIGKHLFFLYIIPTYFLLEKFLKPINDCYIFFENYTVKG